jgi:hypothetical protein
VEALTVLGSILVGLFGGIGVERYRNARKDHEHRQGYYHRLLAAADAYADAVAEGSYPPEVAAAETALISERQGVEVFGAKGIGQAAREFEQAVDREDWDAVPANRQRMIELMRRDVGPSRFGRRS